MAYTSIIPVSRLDNSITYIRNKDKTTKKGQSAGSLEEAIDYAMNRDKTERSVFEDAIGCVCETAYQDMVATKKRYHKMDGVQGYHLVQSLAARNDRIYPHKREIQRRRRPQQDLHQRLPVKEGHDQ